MFKTLFAYIVILIGIAGLVLPVIPGIVLVIIGLNLVTDEQLGTDIVNRLKTKKPFSWLL
jgi:uncharacterized protein YqgC (DUF456 family)